MRSLGLCARMSLYSKHAAEVEYLLWKNGYKRALGVRPHRPRAPQLAAILKEEAAGPGSCAFEEADV